MSTRKKRGFFERLGRGKRAIQLGVKSPRGRERAIQKSKIIENIKDQETAAELAAFEKARLKQAEKRGIKRATRQKKSRIQRIEKTIKRIEKTKTKLVGKPRKTRKRSNPFDFV